MSARRTPLALAPRSEGGIKSGLFGGFGGWRGREVVVLLAGAGAVLGAALVGGCGCGLCWLWVVGWVRHCVVLG